ncbi:MAG: hypothetical protein KGL38_01815 [Gemmatimonadota bacterium]|nr:hypothetical protein [Gemmatimonadota bacterium]
MTGRSRYAAALAAGLAVALAPRAAPAQAIPPTPEVRADLLGPGPGALELGAGVNLGAGYYQRVELDAAGGARGGAGALVGTGRLDALMRLLLDPFGQRRWGLSLAGGVSVRYDAGGKVRPYLAGALDFEGPTRHGVRVAYQVGFGGGVRLGVVIRRVTTHWR